MTPDSPRAPINPVQADAVIIGGGIAGLWVLDRLRSAGYRALLLEQSRLGAGQTLASQGMIHGGLKYALGGKLTGAMDAIKDMPGRWRACLKGQGEVDLRNLPLLAEQYCLFAGTSALGQLTSFFASRSLRGRIEKLAAADYPTGLKHSDFRGVVYGLNDFVVHTPSLIRLLQDRHSEHIYQCEFPTGRCEVSTTGAVLNLGTQTVHAQRLVLTAGAGTEAILASLGLAEPAMQLRPLHQVVVRKPDLPELFAHCLTGIRRPEPRLTITSHRDTDGGYLWYLGGALSTAGVSRGTAEQLVFARQELRACVPWLDWDNAQIDSLSIDRAEPAQASGLRPDSAFVHQQDAVVVAWPTKLSLVPDLGDQVMQAFSGLAGHAQDDGTTDTPLDLPPALCAQEPWLLS